VRYDLAVIGSGGAAFAAAIAARRKGHTAVMVERGTVGGTCVNTGCVPSKALLAAAEARQVSLESRFTGLATSPFAVDLAGLVGGKQDLVAFFRADKYADLAAYYGWEIVAGTAHFGPSETGPELVVELNEGGSRRIEARHYVIATGSAPWAPPIDGLAEAGYLTSTTAMELDRLPSSMIVLGGNAVGLEQAQLWSRLGVSVTLLEAMPRLAPFEEPELSRVIEQVFADEGIRVVTSALVTGVRRDSEYHVTLAHGPELRAGQLLVATGRRPVSAGLGLDTVGVKTGPRGEVVVDDYLRTDNPRIWAAGDVTGHPQFVYVAGAHGGLVADNALEDANRTLDYSTLPRVTFTSPAIASVGLTDAQAVAAGFACECRVVPLEYVPRALVNRDSRGVVKLVAERGTGRLLGAHVVAEGAGDVIAAAGYALTARMSVHDLAEQWSPYLTMAEGLKIAAQAFTRDVTKLSCCA
jgi:mercuric reductase